MSYGSSVKFQNSKKFLGIQITPRNNVLSVLAAYSNALLFRDGMHCHKFVFVGVLFFLIELKDTSRFLILGYKLITPYGLWYNFMTTYH